jgi:ribulose-phosphate 3-epimerase
MVEMAGADIIHCDIMDGQFVPNITFGPLIVETVNRITKLPIDVHLMIRNPENFIERFTEAGADYISVHQEEVVHLNSMIHRIKNLGVKAGVVLNPSTPVSALTEVLDIVDYILIMSVNPGFGGQVFIPGNLNKIETLNEIRRKNNYNFLIEIDGGVDATNVKKISEAGCNIFIAGSSIFKSGNISAATIELKNLM